MIHAHIKHTQHIQQSFKPGKKAPLKQKIWEFIRRNKIFRVGDIIAIYELKPSYAKWLVWFFTKAGVIELAQKDKKYTNRLYRLKKDIGTKAPRIEK